MKKTARRAPTKATKIHQTQIDVRVDELQLDPQNPRLPEDIQRNDPDQLLKFIVDTYEPLEIGYSIAEHGYFPSEPLIVIKEGAHYVVVEGNRRLAALKLMADASQSEKLNVKNKHEWFELAELDAVPATIPAILVANRKSVAPVIGYRHISGIEPWDSWAKARFLAALVDVEKMTFAEAGALVGETERLVREAYRNYQIAKQLDDEDIDTKRVKRNFGTFTRTMQDPGVREFLAIPKPAEVEKAVSPLGNTSKNIARAAEVVRWVFGDKGQPPMFSDSRRVVDLGKILQSPTGLRELRSTGDFDSAFALAGGMQTRLLERLKRAGSYLEAALEDISKHRDDSAVRDAAERCVLLALEVADSVE